MESSYLHRGIESLNADFEADLGKPGIGSMILRSQLSSVCVVHRKGRFISEDMSLIGTEQPNRAQFFQSKDPFSHRHHPMATKKGETKHN